MRTEALFNGGAGLLVNPFPARSMDSSFLNAGHIRALSAQAGLRRIDVKQVDTFRHSLKVRNVGLSTLAAM